MKDLVLRGANVSLQGSRFIEKLLILQNSAPHAQSVPTRVLPSYMEAYTMPDAKNTFRSMIDNDEVATSKRYGVTFTIVGLKYHG